MLDSLLSLERATMAALPIHPHAVALTLGIMACDGLLAWRSARRRLHVPRRTGRLTLIIAWLVSLACVAPPIDTLAEGRVNVITELAAALALALALSIALHLMTEARLALATAWASWAGLAVLILLAVGRAVPLAAVGLALVMLAGPAVWLAASFPLVKASRLAFLLLAASLLLAIASLVTPSPTSVLVAATNGRPALAFVTEPSPAGADLDTVERGVVTVGLDQTDRVVQLPFHGLLAVSKPDFEQLVHLSILAEVAHDPHQLLAVRALGVPLPSGALQLRSATITLRAPGLVGRGTASVVLARSIFGVLRSRHHVYSYLLSYQPTAGGGVTGTLELWRRHVATALR